MIDRAVQNIFAVLDPSYAGKEAINAKDDHIRTILNRELDISKGVSGEAVIDFIASLQTNNEDNERKKVRNSLDKDKLFTDNINELFGYYEEVYQNRFIEIKDLQFIAKFIPSLGEAVKTQLDAVVASDSISDDINLSFTLPSSATEENRRAILDEITRQEQAYHLRSKLKNVVFKKTLVTGMHYVYAKAYSEIFQEYDAIKKRNDQTVTNMQSTQFGSKKATESFDLGDVSISMESVLPQIKQTLDSKATDVTIKNAAKQWQNELPKFKCESSNILTDALESLGMIGEDEQAMEAVTTAITKKNGTYTSNDFFGDSISGTPEAAKDPSDTKSEKVSTFSIDGTYIQYINAKELIPIRVFDTTLAYARVRTQNRSKMRNTNSLGIGNSIFGNMDYSKVKQEEVIQNLTNSISDGVLNAFSEPFVRKNAKFKELIANCILANGLTGKDYNIQIIPAEDIIPFRIQEDENGFGTSMITDSLFPGKALLSLIVSRLLNYINKTGNKTVAHIHKGPVGTFENNMVDRVLRDLQDGEVTFYDLLSTNLAFNKFNKNGNIQMPMAKNGNHLVELETMEGQNIDMNPEYETKLEQMCIIGSGVPTTVMDYDQSADFAKEVVSSHIKFAGRTGTLQADLETPTTEFYRRLLKNSSLTDEQKKIAITGLEVKLPRPKVRTNENTSEFIQSVAGTAGDIASGIIGAETLQDTEHNPTAGIMKDKLQFEIMKDMLPFIDWEGYVQKYKRIESEFGSKEKDTDQL